MMNFHFRPNVFGGIICAGGRVHLPGRCESARNTYIRWRDEGSKSYNRNNGDLTQPPIVLFSSPYLSMGLLEAPKILLSRECSGCILHFLVDSACRFFALVSCHDEW